MLQTLKFQPLLASSFWVKKEKEKKKPHLIYKSSFQICGEKLLTRLNVFLSFVSLSRKRLCKGLSIQYTENNVIIGNKPPAIFEGEVGKWKQQNIEAKYITKFI